MKKSYFEDQIARLDRSNSALDDSVNNLRSFKLHRAAKRRNLPVEKEDYHQDLRDMEL